MHKSNKCNFLIMMINIITEQIHISTQMGINCIRTVTVKTQALRMLFFLTLQETLATLR